MQPTLLKKAAILILLLALPAFPQRKKPKEVKPGMNFFSVEQDIQLGREYAAQIEKEKPPLDDPRLNAFANKMLKRLTQSRHAGDFPYTIKVIYDDSINAFALPGGPMYLHTGLIKAADNEAQVAGVLAHEISHVVLRHGTNQASKAQMFGLGAALGGGMLGGGLAGQLAQLGIGLGANSVLLKYSRGAETDADINGTRMMADVGYEPTQMARFFEKLEKEGGRQSGIEEFFSSHPNPGNRVKRVQEEIGFLTPKQYDLGDQREFEQIRAYLGTLKAPARPAGPAGGGAGAGGGGRLSLPSQAPSTSFKTFRGNGFEIGYPENWVAGTSQQGGGVIAPRESVDAQSGAIALGTMFGTYQPQRARDLPSATEELVNSILQGNPGMRVAGRAERIQVSGRDAYLVMLDGNSPLGGTERDVLVSTVNGRVLQYFVFVAPQAQFASYEPVFQNMLRSVRF